MAATLSLKLRYARRRDSQLILLRRLFLLRASAEFELSLDSAFGLASVHNSQFTIYNLQIKQRIPTWGAFFVSLKAIFNQKSRPPFRVVGLLSEWAVVSEKPLRVLPAKQLSVGVPNVSQRLPPPRGLLHHIRLTKRAVPKAPTRSSTPRSYYRDSRAYRRGTPRLR